MSRRIPAACLIALTLLPAACLIALTLLPAASAQPPAVAQTVYEPPWWVAVIGQAGLAYKRLAASKPTSTSVALSTYTSTGATVTHSWTNTTTFYFPGWSMRHTATASSAAQRFTVRYALNTPTWLAVKPVFTASSGASVTVAVIANATSAGSVTSCAVGASALGGRIVACLSTVGTGSLLELEWVNVSYTTAVALAAIATANHVTALGAYLDVARAPWYQDWCCSIPASPGRPVYAFAARFDRYYATVEPAPGERYMECVYAEGFWPSSFAIAASGPLPYRFSLDLVANVTLELVFSSGARASLAPMWPRLYVYASEMPAWLNVTADAGWIKVAAPQPDEHILLAAVPREQSWVSFHVMDYGQNYAQLRFYTREGRLAWRDEISPATRAAVARLVPYAAYIVALWKPGEERALGPLVVDRTSFTLSVLSRVEGLPPPPWATVAYNSTLGGYIIDVACASPPCTVRLVRVTYLPAATLEASFTVPESGGLVMPHLYTWSFDGVDDYMWCSSEPEWVIKQRAEGGSARLGAWGFGDIDGCPACSYASRAGSEREVRELQGLQEVSLEELWLPVRPKPNTGRGVTFMIGSYTPWVPEPGTYFSTSSGEEYEELSAYWAWVLNETKVFFNASYSGYINRWLHSVRRFTASRVISFWANGTMLASTTVPANAETPPSAPEQYIIGCSVYLYDYMRMKIEYARVWGRALPDAEIQAYAAGSAQVNASGLLLFVDPTWCNGTHCFTPLDDEVVCKPFYGGAHNLPERLPSARRWLWLLQGFPGDGKLHFRYFPEGSYALVRCARQGSVYTSGVRVGWNDTAVEAKGSCTVTVVTGTYSYAEEVASFACQEVSCRFTWLTDDAPPAGASLTVTVTDARGSSYTSWTGGPGLLPAAGDWERGLIVFLLGDTAALLGVDPVVLLIVLAAVGTFLTLGVAGYIDVACFATAAIIAVLQARYGVTVYTAVVSALLILGGIYAVARRVR